MWAWQTLMMMMTSLVVMVVFRGVAALPTSFYSNERPVIGILAQEIHGPLANALVKVLASEPYLQIYNLNSDSSSIVERSVQYGEDSSNMESLGEDPELSSDPEDKEKMASNSPVMVSETTTGLPKMLEIQEESSLEQSHRLEYQSTSSGSVEPPTTQPPHPPIPKNASYIAASYVKFVESGGARVVPIFVNKDRDYYEHILKSINGVLFPGGAVAIDDSSAFGKAGKIIYEIAKDMNDAGEVFPLWGTCLGFELMMGLAANGQEIRAECDAQNLASRLKLDPDHTEGYLFRHLPKKMIKGLTQKPITSNFHHYCVTPKNFSAFGIDKIYRPLAYGADRRGVAFVAAAEARDYPFFAVQFHPEKNPYEWTTKPGHSHIPHSSLAISTSNHFAQVYVDYARRSKHRFTDQSEEASSLIYNYVPVYTGQHSAMEQIYVF